MHLILSAFSDKLPYTMRLAILLLTLCVLLPATAQVRAPRNTLRANVQDRAIPTQQSQEALRSAVRDIESGLRASTITFLSDLMAPNVQLALPDLGRGDYSSNQALQLLSGFLSRRPIRSASIDRIESAIASPYAAGTIVVSGPGRDTLHLYLSFAATDSRWLITHFSLY